jgi:hypothetical protein
MKKRLHDAVALITKADGGKLKFVGLVEYWNDSLRLFCRTFSCISLEQSLKAKPERQRQQQTQSE